LSAERNFQRKSDGFQYVSGALFGFLYDGLVSVWLGFVVRFYVVCGALSCWLWCALPMLTHGSAVKEISKEEGD